MITFELGKKNKIIFKCDDTSLFTEIREHFSVKNEAASFFKRYNRFIPSRKYMITPAGQCELGMYWEIRNYLFDKQKIVDVKVDSNLDPIINCGIQYKFYDNLKLQLRDYQRDVVHKALQFGRGICVLGTGAGKTLTTATLIENYFQNCNNNEKFKCLVIVPDLTLVNQTYKEFEDVGVSFTITKWTGTYKPDLTSNVIICNISILQNQIEANDWVNYVDLLIVDECHKAKAEVSSKIINNIKTPHKYGFTGTLPDKNEERWSVLGKLGPVLYTKNSHELREEKFLANVEARVIKITYSQLHQFEYNDELEFIHKNTFRNDVIKKICEKFNNNILILVNHIAHGEALFEHFKDLNKQVYFIRGEVDVEERDKVKQIMEDSNNVVCIAISAIFSTGVNIKNIHMICFAAGGKSFIRTVQSIGRGLRLHEDKNKLIIIDIQDNLKYGFKHGETRKQIYDKEKIKFLEKEIIES